VSRLHKPLAQEVCTGTSMRGFTRKPKLPQMHAPPCTFLTPTGKKRDEICKYFSRVSRKVTTRGRRGQVLERCVRGYAKAPPPPTWMSHKWDCHCLAAVLVASWRHASLSCSKCWLICTYRRGSKKRQERAHLGDALRNPHNSYSWKCTSAGRSGSHLYPQFQSPSPSSSWPPNLNYWTSALHDSIGTM